jgi:hypothetical protein
MDLAKKLLNALFQNFLELHTVSLFFLLCKMQKAGECLKYEPSNFLLNARKHGIFLRVRRQFQPFFI